MKIKFASILLTLAVLFIPLAASAQTGHPLPAATGTIRKVGTVPVNGTNEIQTLTFGGTPTAGTFTLTYEGATTSAITWSSTNGTLVSNIDTALEALRTIGTGGVTTAVGVMTAGIGTITVTFTGNNAKLNVDEMTASSSLTGTAPTLTPSTTTPGVTADGRGYGVGQILVTQDAGLLYINTSVTALNPAWVKVGAQ